MIPCWPRNRRRRSHVPFPHRTRRRRASCLSPRWRGLRRERSWATSCRLPEPDYQVPLRGRNDFIGGALTNPASPSLRRQPHPQPAPLTIYGRREAARDTRISGEVGRQPWRREASTRVFWSRYCSISLRRIRPRSSLLNVVSCGFGLWRTRARREAEANLICSTRGLCIPKRQKRGFGLSKFHLVCSATLPLGTLSTGGVNRLTGIREWHTGMLHARILDCLWIVGLHGKILEFVLLCCGETLNFVGRGV
jgi:hypothetical protein